MTGPSSDSTSVCPAKADQAPRATKLPTLCANCGAVAPGNYCSACGQGTEFHLHSLRDLLGDAFEVLTHADSRLWRTLLPLVGRPGFLTQQFLAGHRARYLSPLRLYFIVSVLFFLIVSVTGAPSSHTSAAHAEVPYATPAPSGINNDLSSSADMNTKRTELCERLVGHSLFPGANKLRQPFVSACVKSQTDNGEQLRESFIRNLGRAMFLFLPVLAGFMKLMYWRPRRSYVTHLLVLVHNHAFLFLLLTLALAVTHWIRAASSALLATALLAYSIYYLYQSMRRVYSESWQRTLFKFAALSMAYVVCAVCTVLFVGLYSAETL